MKSEDIDYGVVLADLEAKKSAIENAIAGIKMMLGQGQATATSSNGGTDIDTNEIPSDAFFQMPVPDAIRKYLRLVKRPRSVRDITDALEKGGITHTSKAFVNNVSTALFRNANKENGFVKVKSEWGLMEWYPGRKIVKGAAGKSDSVGTDEEAQKATGSIEVGNKNE